MRALCPVLSCCVVAATFAVSSKPVGASESTVPSAAPIVPITAKAVVWIEPIGDSGGAGQKTGEDETLARRFTRGLRTALEGEAKERFEVRITPRPSAPMGTPEVRFVLRGGLSRVQDEEDQDAAGDHPYLCIVRLFQESIPARGGKPTRRLVGQWAGTARGLRDLTGNLNRDPRVHILGLAGELSRRVSQTTLRKIEPSAPVPPPLPVSAGDTDSPPAVLVLEGVGR